MTVTVDIWRPGYYSDSGWKTEQKGQVGVDEDRKVLYIEVDGEKVGIDLDDAKRLFNFFLNK